MSFVDIKTLFLRKMTQESRFCVKLAKQQVIERLLAYFIFYTKPIAVS
jgi:hypothetical protein